MHFSIIKAAVQVLLKTLLSNYRHNRQTDPKKDMCHSRRCKTLQVLKVKSVAFGRILLSVTRILYKNLSKKIPVY